MPEADAVVDGIVAGSNPENPNPAPQHNQSGAQAPAASGDWESALAEEFKGTVKAKGWKGPNDVVKSYVELEKFASKSLQDMSPEEQGRFYKRLGRPEKPGEYELSDVALPDGVPRQPKADDELKAWAHENGLTKAQLKSLHKWSMERAAQMIVESRRTSSKQAEEQDAVLRKEWGSDTEANTARVNSLIAKFGGDEAVQYFNSGPGKSPVMKKFLYNITRVMSDETFVGGGVAASNRVAGDGGMVVDFEAKSPELAGANRFGRR